MLRSLTLFVITGMNEQRVEMPCTHKSRPIRMEREGKKKEKQEDGGENSGPSFEMHGCDSISLPLPFLNRIYIDRREEEEEEEENNLHGKTRIYSRLVNTHRHME